MELHYYSMSGFPNCGRFAVYNGPYMETEYQVCYHAYRPHISSQTNFSMSHEFCINFHLQERIHVVSILFITERLYSKLLRIITIDHLYRLNMGLRNWFWSNVYVMPSSYWPFPFRYVWNYSVCILQFYRLLHWLCINCLHSFHYLAPLIKHGSGRLTFLLACRHTKQDTDRPIDWTVMKHLIMWLHREYDYKPLALASINVNLNLNLKTDSHACDQYKFISQERLRIV